MRPDWPSWRVSPVPNRPFCDGYHIGGSGCAACSVYNADTVPFFFVQPEAPTIVKSSRLNSNSEQYRAHAADCRQRAKEACILRSSIDSKRSRCICCTSRMRWKRPTHRPALWGNFAGAHLAQLGCAARALGETLLLAHDRDGRGRRPLAYVVGAVTTGQV